MLTNLTRVSFPLFGFEAVSLIPVQNVHSLIREETDFLVAFFQQTLWIKEVCILAKKKKCRFLNTRWSSVFSFDRSINIWHLFFRWCFDVELVYLCKHIGIPMIEVSVNWSEIPGSKVRLTSILHMLFELMLIRLGYGLGIWKIYT